MDFFAQQERARRNTRLLVVLFSVAVLVLILLTNALIGGFLWVTEDYNLYAGTRRSFVDALQHMSPERFAAISLAVAGTVAMVSLFRWLQLSAGGQTVAESMGGRRVLRQSTSLEEKRALNIVDEMALAANMPAPALYLLPDERGINAFAAGSTPADAVVALTRGALLQLNRDELQGVIAHEFSHILNGDMRLGIRLAALLKGITFIGDIGHLLLRGGAYGVRSSGRRSSETAALPIVGLGLLVLGYLGSLAAGFIKAAISRQKEYLADASAVQFTRSNEGIANALKVIGGFLPGSLVHAARAEEMSHIFFGEVRHHIWNPFATHPPLRERIQRLDSSWDGEYIKREERRYGTGELTPEMVQAGVGREALVLAAAASVAAGAAAAGREEPAAESRGTATADAARAAASTVPSQLQRAGADPLGATALALAMLVNHRPEAERNSLRLIGEQGVPGQLHEVETLLPQVRTLEPGERFPLIALAMPALKSLSAAQYRRFKSTLLLVIRADRRTDLFEWCLFQLLRHYLDPHYLRVRPSRPRHGRLAKVRGPLRQVLSVLAHQGSGDPARAFGAAASSLDMPSLSLQPLEQCTVTAFGEAVHELADCYPLLKPRVLKAMALAAADDGAVCATEREIVTAVAAVMDCPVPEELQLETPAAD